MRADLTAATVEDVCEWVGSLGLDEYVATFQHHGTPRHYTPTERERARARSPQRREGSIWEEGGSDLDGGC